MPGNSKLAVIDYIPGLLHSNLCTVRISDIKFFFGCRSDEKEGVSIVRNSLPIQKTRVSWLRKSAAKGKQICGLEIVGSEIDDLITVTKEEKQGQVLCKALYWRFNEETKQVKQLCEIILQDFRWPSCKSEYYLQPGDNPGEFFFIGYWYSGLKGTWTGFAVSQIFSDDNGCTMKSVHLKDNKKQGRWFQPLVVKNGAELVLIMLREKDGCYPEMFVQSLSKKDSQFVIWPIETNSNSDRPPPNGMWSPPRYFSGMMFSYVFSPNQKSGAFWALDLIRHRWLPMAEYTLVRENHPGANYLSISIQANGECYSHAGQCGTFACQLAHWYKCDFQPFLIHYQEAIINWQAETIVNMEKAQEHKLEEFNEIVRKRDLAISVLQEANETLNNKQLVLEEKCEYLSKANNQLRIKGHFREQRLNETLKEIQQHLAKLVEREKEIDQLKKDIEQLTELFNRAVIEKQVLENDKAEKTSRILSLEEQLSLSKTSKETFEKRHKDLLLEKETMVNKLTRKKEKMKKLEGELQEKIQQLSDFQRSNNEEKGHLLSRIMASLPWQNKLKEPQHPTGQKRPKKDKQCEEEKQEIVFPYDIGRENERLKYEIAAKDIALKQEKLIRQQADEGVTTRSRTLRRARESLTDERPAKVLKSQEVSEDDRFRAAVGPMSQQHRDRLTSQMPFLCEQVNNVVVSTTLYSKRILTDFDVQEIKQEKTPFEANNKLIRILMTRGPYAFPAFIAALEAAGQWNVRNPLVHHLKSEVEIREDASECEQSFLESNEHCSYNDNDDNEEIDAMFEYIPPSREYLTKVAESLNILPNVSSVIAQLGPQKNFGTIWHPIAIRKVENDGNCFFRAISVLFFGSQRHCCALRAAITHFIDQDVNKKISRYLGGENTHRYLLRKRMRHYSAWATDTEILATAALYRCNIFVFDQVNDHQYKQWKCYNSNMSTGEAISGIPSFLLNYTQNHFDPVLRI